MLSMEPADSSRIFSWVQSQSLSVHSGRQNLQNSGSFPQCCRRSVSSSSSKATCPHQVHQATPPATERNHICRKRQQPMPVTERSSSPRKRLRGQDGDTSFSPLGSSRNVTVLDSRTALSATSVESSASPKRNHSPTRDHAIELRTASPWIQTDNIIGVDLPKRVRELRRFLIAGFGRCRQTSGDQRRYLARIANAYQTSVANALSGTYDPELDVNSPLKLRMHIRRLNDAFAKVMTLKGHAKVFFTVQGTVDQEFARSGDVGADIIQWIRESYRESRGAELPGTVNPGMLQNLFRQQSSPWEHITTTYLKSITAKVREFNQDALQRLIPDEELRGKLKSKLSPGEIAVATAAHNQLATILNDERGGILQTVNHYFADALSSIRQERVLARLESAGIRDGCVMNLAAIMKSVHLSNEDQAVNDIHDILKAYYKVALKRYTDNVVIQITERLILGPDGPVRSLSSDMIGDFRDDELMDIAGENFATANARNELLARSDRLQNALDIARQAIV